MYNFEEWCRLRQASQVVVKAELTRVVDPKIRSAMLILDDTNELMIAAEIDNSTQGIIRRIVSNVAILKSLTMLPKSAENLEAIEVRTNLGCELHQMLARQVKVKQTGPLFKKHFRITKGVMVVDHDPPSPDLRNVDNREKTEKKIEVEK